MIYLCDSGDINVTQYYVEKRVNRILKTYRNYKFKDISRLLVSNPLLPPCNLVELKDKAPPQLERKIKTPKFNDTYICVDSLKEWDIFTQYEILKLDPNEFVESLKDIQSILDPIAFNWIKDKFRYSPRKLDLELSFLKEKYLSQDSIPLSLEYVYQRYERLPKTDLIHSIKRNELGSSSISSIIKNSEEAELWSIFIGTEEKPPYIYYLLKNKEDYKSIRLLTRAQESIKRGEVGVKPGLIILNEGIRIAEEENNFELSWDTLL